MKDYFKRLLSLVMVVLMVLSMMPSTAFAAQESCTHGNIVLYREAVTSCVAPSNGAVYVCKDCGEFFKDAEGTEKSAGQEIVFPTGHQLETVEGEAYYHCSVCDQYFENDEAFAIEAIEVTSGTFNGGMVNMEDPERTFLTLDSSNVYAEESFVIKVYDANDTLLATTSLVDHGDILGKKFDTLSTMVGINCTDSYWDTKWEDGKLGADYVPAYGVLYVDGQEMNRADIRMITTSGEQAVKWADVPGVAKAVAQIGETKYADLLAAINAAGDGDTVTILADGTYKLPSFSKNLTIKAAEGAEVTIDNGGAVALSGAKVTFENLTFDYYPNKDYTGLQHVDTVVYNNCTINGQVFLYGASETFNGCTFNQNSADAYNVWTYSADQVAFNKCTFNCEGKSVLVYNEGDGATDVTVTDCKFIANQAVAGKAAIEIDTTLMPDGTDIVISNSTATGFDAGSVSGETLWNDKKDQTDLPVTVDGKKVWPIPELPTATITEIKKDDLTFAMNFKADEVTEEQLEYYYSWYADLVLTVNQNVTLSMDGTGDGYVAGQYDNWDPNWIYVPGEGEDPIVLKADEPLRVMAAAAEMLGQPDLRVTFNDVYTFVKDFNCGAFFDKTKNPGLEVTLELRMYNPEDETESYVIGETYKYTVPEMPTATVTEIEKDGLTYAMNFAADEATEEQQEFYGDWFADFVLTINKDVTFNAEGGADGYLSGSYGNWENGAWINVPYNGSYTLNANEPLKIMETAAALMGQPGLKVTYNDICTFVQNFNCGLFFTDEFLAANPDLEISLELRMYNPSNPEESYGVSEEYVFTNEYYVAWNVNTKQYYTTVAQALNEAQAGQTVQLLRDSDESTTVLTVLNRITLDLNGHTLSAYYALTATTGSFIIDSTDGKGLLKVAKDNLGLADNTQLKIWKEEESGYRFANATFTAGLINGNVAGTTQFAFWLNERNGTIMQELFDGTDDNDGLSIQVKLTYSNSQGGISTLYFDFPASLVQDYANKEINKPEGGYLYMNISGLDKVSNVSFAAVIRSGSIMIESEPVIYQG